MRSGRRRYLGRGMVVFWSGALEGGGRGHSVLLKSNTSDSIEQL